MNIDDYSNFEKPLLTPAGIARLLIALSGVTGLGFGLFGGIALGSGALATGGVAIAIISAGLFFLARLVE